MDQHIVTRAYLEAFRDPALPRRSLWVVDLRQGRIRCAAPRNVATEVDYYSWTRPDGTLSDGVEKILARVETVSAPILKKIRAGDFSLTADDRSNLALFISLMFVRVRAFRLCVENAGADVMTAYVRFSAGRPDYFEEHFIRRHGLAMTAERAAEYREAMSQATVGVDHEFSLRYILQSALALESILSRMGWTFLVSKRDPFITGDTPATKSSEKVDLRRPVGLRDSDIDVTFPISPSVCLLARWTNDLRVREAGDAEVARVNRARVRYAHEQVFASSEAAARRARTVYTKLRDRGEAHVKPVNMIVLQDDGPQAQRV
jgi:hypothetical protein